MAARPKKPGTQHVSPLPKLFEHPSLDRREGERRKPRTLWQRIKRWMNRRWGNWKRWLRAIFDAAGIAMGAFSFFNAFGPKVFMTMLAAGLFLAPIDIDD